MMTAYNKGTMGGTPYFNDFDEDKKFLQMMFKPGFPVQARELSQLQSILQNQIERFGNHIFKNGSVVLGGEVSTSKAAFIRISPNTELTESVLESMVGQTIRASSGNITTDAKVVGFADKVNFVDDAYQVLFCQYLTPGSFQQNQSIETVGTNNIGVSITSLSGVTAPGVGTVANFVSVNPGVYYVDGYFNKNDSQGYAPYNTVRNGSTASYRDFSQNTISVGFDVNRSIVSVDDDSSLRDPSFGFNNFNAPGADRYKIDLKMSQRGLTGTNSSGYSVLGTTGGSYVELIRIVDNKSTKKIKYPEYAELEKTLARRTYDESGHYTVIPFPAETDTYLNTFGSSDSTKFGVILAPGKAYVRGFEFETIANTKLESPYPNSLATIENVNQYSRQLGSFFEFTNGAIKNLLTDTSNVFLRSTRMFMYDAGVNIIGSFNPLHIARKAGTGTQPVRMYVANISFNSGKKPSDIAYISDRTTDPLNTDNNLITFDNAQRLIQSGSSRRLFKVGSGVKNLSNPVNLEGIRTFTGQVNAQGNAVIQTLDGRRTFAGFKGRVNGSLIGPTLLLRNSSGESSIIRSDDFSVNSANNTISISVGAEFSNSSFVAFLPINITDKSAVRTKTLSGDITSSLTFTDATSEIRLGAVDVKEVTSIINTDTGLNVIDDFVLNDGQTEEAYLESTLSLKANATAPADGATMTVTFKKYERSGSNGPFTVDSYSNVATKDVPKFNGHKLTEFIDFRADEVVSTISGIDGSFNYSIDPLNPNNCDPVIDPGNGDIVTVNYAARIDSVVLTQDRTFKLIQGELSNFPEPPYVSPNDMELYRLIVPAYATTPEDIRIEYIDNQRFTMKEIGELEKTQQLDSEFNYTRQLINDATNRAKSLENVAPVSLTGVFVDEFIGHGNADLTRVNYNASIDPVRNRLRPPFVSSSVGINTPTVSDVSGATINGDLIISDHTEAVLSSEFECTGKERLNEFGSIDYYGKLDLSPYCVNYWSETQKPKIASNFDGELNNWEFSVVIKDDSNNIAGRNNGFGTTWRDWEFHWFSTMSIDPFDQDTNPLNRTYTESSKTSFVARALSKRIVERLGNKIVDLSIRPYIPATTVTLTAKGLRPNSIVYLFFDDAQVGNETGYVVSEEGSVSITYELPSDTYTVGKKRFLITDNVDGDVTEATTSADAFFYAQGAINTDLNGETFIRPPVVKRVSSTSNNTRLENFNELFNSTSDATLNTINPIYQIFSVDPTGFPNGAFIKKVRLWFDESSDTGTPIQLSIRPVIDGVPSSSIIIPFSEKVQPCVDDAVLTDPTPDSPRNLEDSGDTFTDFEFDSPVYLPYGDYALAVSSNDTSLSVRTSNNPNETENFGALYLPNNRGSNTPYFDKRLCVGIYSCVFTSGNTPTARFTLTDTSIDANTFYASNSPNVDSDFTNSIVLGGDSGSFDVSLPENGTFERSFGPRLSYTNPVMTYTLENSTSHSTTIDIDRVSLLATKMISNDATVGGIVKNEVVDEIAEDGGSDLAAPGLARYYTKIIEMDEAAPADDIAVFIDGLFPGRVPLVFVKPQGTEVGSENIDESRYYQLYLGGNVQSLDPGGDSVTSLIYTTYKEGAAAGEEPATFTNLSFTKYIVKIVFTDDAATVSGIPYIEYLAAVPIRRSFGAFGLTNLALPSGTLIPYAGQLSDGQVPKEIAGGGANPLFLPCDGGVYLQDEFGSLFGAIDQKYARGEADAQTLNANGEFRVPDFRGRLGVGSNSTSTGGLNQNTSGGPELIFSKPSKTRELGVTGGSYVLQGHNHLNAEGEPGYDNAGEFDMWTDGPYTIDGRQRVNHFGPGSSDAGRAKLNYIFVDDGVDASGAELDGNLTEQMPPFVSINYLIKT
tara:strand:- start:624 stop:6215 length:5592 start_codon:yes stop_codon:yes gene_type:complete